MVVCKYKWEKWYITVKKRMFENDLTLLLTLNEDESGTWLHRKCSLEEMRKMFPEPIDPPEIRIIELLHHLEDSEKPIVEKWIDYVVPILIDEGIKRVLG